MTSRDDATLRYSGAAIELKRERERVGESVLGCQTNLECLALWQLPHSHTTHTPNRIQLFMGSTLATLRLATCEQQRQTKGVRERGVERGVELWKS